VSRKTVIGEVLGLPNPEDRDPGTIACVSPASELTLPFFGSTCPRYQFGRQDSLENPGRARPRTFLNSAQSARIAKENEERSIDYLRLFLEECA